MLVVIAALLIVVMLLLGLIAYTLANVNANIVNLHRSIKATTRS